MSWSIFIAGHKDKVRSYIRRCHAHPEESPKAQEQIEAAKALIEFELERWPYEGVIVDAHGHHDASTRNLYVDLKGLPLLSD